MHIKYYSLAGILSYFGFFLMGSLISQLIPWAITTGKLGPSAIEPLVLAVTCVNAALYVLLFCFYLGYFLYIKDLPAFKYLCLAGAIVSLFCLGNVVIFTGDYGLSLGLKMMLDIMSFAVHMGFMGLTISLHSEKKFLVAMAILSMFPFSSYPLFAAVAISVLFWHQMHEVRH